ncbi:hypothetical protein OCOL_001554 [Ordospora colligata]|uniref:Uncharacterized protein n=1 Tax=Ordospora colligata OC4 TaxID=1354746 RepID=A0A0B2UMV9_9MICR|nr:uncharacterized protein M896_021080 [Ordospora colligata OC4]KHN70270.1 hypothetical protein M896_021080 [Ordospora colligata OC4]
MEVELKDEVKRVFEIIRMNLAFTGTDGTPSNVVSAVIDTVLELGRKNEHTRIDELLQIILAYKEHVEDGVCVNELIRMIVTRFDDDAIWRQGFRLMKHFVNVRRHSIEHMKIVVEECFLKKGMRKKAVELIESYLSEEKFCEWFVEYLQELDDINWMRHVNCFFKYLHGKIDVRRNLGEMKDKLMRGRSGSMDGKQNLLDDSERKALYSECCDLLYNYTAVEMSVEDVNEDVFEYVIRELEDLFEMEHMRGGKLLMVFSMISEKDLGIFLRSGRHMMKVSMRVKCAIRREFEERKLDNEQVYEFIRSIRHLLGSEFLGLVRFMGEKYIEGDNKYQFVLGAVGVMMGIEELLGMYDDDLIDVERWAPVLRASCNSDIWFFMKLYKRVIENEGKNSMKMCVLLNCLPAFCNYCSDHSGMIGEFIEVMKMGLSNRNVVSSVYNGLNRMIHSHQSNIKGGLALRNSIAAEDSKRILEVIFSSGIGLEILCIESGEGSEELDVLLQRLFEVEDYGICEKVREYIVYHPKIESIGVGRWNLSGVSDTLRVARYFVGRMHSDFEFYGKLIEFVQSSESGIQKRAYQLLCCMKREQKIDLCICDSMFSHEVVENLKDSSLRWRIQLLYEIYKNGCGCFDGRRKEYFNKMIPALVIGMTVKNVKARKASDECLGELVSMLDEELFEYYCKMLYAGMKSENVELRSGILEATACLIEEHSERLSDEYVGRMYEECVSTSRLGKEGVLHVLRFLDVLIEMRKIEYSLCIEILELYADNFKRRYLEEIKQVVRKLISKGVELSKRLIKILNERKPMDVVPRLQITKKNDVVFMESKRGKHVERKRGVSAKPKHVKGRSRACRIKK